MAAAQPVIHPPLPASLPAGVFEQIFSFVSATFTGPAASVTSLRLDAKKDANQKLQIMTALVNALPVPSPRKVRAQGPHVAVIQYIWTVNPNPAGILVAVEYVVLVWSEY
jgi:hypothetical protein